MRTIYFISNMHMSLFPKNTRSNFQTYMSEEVLNYIPEGAIEVAVKSITFDNSRFEHEGTVLEATEESLALRTNLIPSVISSFGYADVASIFTVRRPGLAIFEFHNPTFFESSKERLLRAKFRIENFSTGIVPEFRVGCPTLVEIAVRQQVPRLKEPFQMLLDSSCPDSKKNFTFNTNSDFITQLPQRLDFQKDWIVCLKSIHLSNEINTIHDCWGKVGLEDHFKLEDGYVTNLSTVLEQLNEKCSGKLIFELANKERVVVIKVDAKYWNENKGKEKALTLHLSNNLCHLLGFSMRENGVNDFLFDKVDKTFKSSFNANIFSLQPRQFVVCADFVEHSALGGEQVQMLKYFVVPEMEQKNKRLDVDFNMNAYVKLSNKNFDRIHIRILSAADGQLVKSNPHSPTLLQLLFVNTNSPL